MSPDHGPRLRAQEIRNAHAETLRVFTSVDGATSPREAAKQAADYMLEVLLSADALLRASASALHMCARCHHRWEGEGGAEYCGDCHRQWPFHVRASALSPELPEEKP